MAYKIIQSQLFLTKVIHLLEYLEKTWGKKVSEEFKQKLDTQILSLLKQLDKGKNCKLPNVKRLLITPHNKLFYRVKGKTIYIITFFDMRQDPKKISMSEALTKKYDPVKYKTPTGTQLSCKGWIQEAALRMLFK